MSGKAPKAVLIVTMSTFPGPHIVTAVSKLISEFCSCLIDDPDDIWRFHMAAQELSENLAKYSSGRQASISAELLDGAESITILRLQAKNSSTPEQLRAVEVRLQELTKALDPVAFYDRLIVESAPRHEGSGLGLARIRAEAALNVDYLIEGTEVTISVHAAVSPRGVA